MRTECKTRNYLENISKLSNFEKYINYNTAIQYYSLNKWFLNINWVTSKCIYKMQNVYICEYNIFIYYIRYILCKYVYYGS